MKIAVIGGNGKAGSAIVKEALARGLDVTSIQRKEGAPEGAKLVQKDLFDLTYADVHGFDAVVDAFGAWTPETLPQHSTSLAHIADVLAGRPNHLYVVGGAGGLYVDAAHTTQLMDTPDFPEVFIPVAKATGEGFEELQKRDDVNWTYLCPAADFRADGERTGRYILAGEELATNGKGESVISYADYAIAMVDLIQKGGYTRQRVSVVQE